MLNEIPEFKRGGVMLHDILMLLIGITIGGVFGFMLVAFATAPRWME